MKPFFDEHSVGAQINVLAFLKDVTHEPTDLRIDHRLSAANAHDWRAAFIDRGQTFLDTQFFFNGLRIFPNSAASRAGQVASVQWLEHENERKSLFASQLLLGDISGHRRG
jgi:hypothetical protein